MNAVDVVVVGAGPGGAAAAIELARAGLEVAVVDKATFPRDKCCGDGLTAGALRHLEELGLDPGAVASWHEVAGCWVRSPSGRTIEFPFPPTGTFGAVATRRDLDGAMVDLASKSGAACFLGHALRDVTTSGDGVTVTVDGLAPLAARYLVAADGVWSPVRRAIGAAEPGYLGEWHAFRQYLHADTDTARRLWVWFEEHLLPGYAWSFPLAGDVVNVGFGILRRAGEPTRSMAETWRRLLDIPHIRAALGETTPVEAHRAWPIPAHLPEAQLSGAGGRVLFVGDAARAADPMTGEGIGQALETGRLVARLIVGAGPQAPAEAAAAYRRVLGRTMMLDHRMAGLLSRALRSPRGARGAVRIAGATEWTRRNFARWLFEDYPRAMVATPWRWRRNAPPYAGHRPMFRDPPHWI